jgi:hypothetical protein
MAGRRNMIYIALWLAVVVAFVFWIISVGGHF